MPDYEKMENIFVFVEWMNEWRNPVHTVNILLLWEQALYPCSSKLGKHILFVKQTDAHYIHTSTQRNREEES